MTCPGRTDVAPITVPPRLRAGLRCALTTVASITAAVASPCIVLSNGCADGSDALKDRAVASLAIRDTQRDTLASSPEVELFREAFERVERVLSTPGLPGAPGFEARRAELVARAKGEPVLFVRTPRYASELRGIEDPELERFSKARGHYGAVARLLERHAGNYAQLRALLLREGYLYSENPNGAFALLSQVGPQHLFGDPEIWIQRGERLMHAERRGSAYVYTDGPHQGEGATLVHLDRIGTGTVPPALHRDLRSLKYRLHFDEARVAHITETHLVLQLRYGEEWVTSLARAEGARLELEAELVEPERRPQVEAAKAANAAHQAALQRLRQAMADQVSERLPFDEPKTELGQEDGRLRGVWRGAYLAGHREYRYNEDTYRVFSSAGAPLVPQVCIDFVVDTFERASGTWWNPAPAPRQRQVGALDWRETVATNLRRTDSFIAFAREQRDGFEVLEVPKAQQIRMGEAPRFFGDLARRVDDFQAGDIVLVRGFTPWDEEEQHSHAFVIYETDPLTRMPILVAGNAGPANLWSWETEARRTPRRTVRYRIRPKAAWLSRVVQAPTERDEPPLLLRRENAAVRARVAAYSVTGVPSSRHE